MSICPSGSSISARISSAPFAAAGAGSIPPRIIRCMAPPEAGFAAFNEHDIRKLFDDAKSVIQFFIDNVRGDDEMMATLASLLDCYPIRITGSMSDLKTKFFEARSMLAASLKPLSTEELNRLKMPFNELTKSMDPALKKVIHLTQCYQTLDKADDMEAVIDESKHYLLSDKGFKLYWSVSLFCALDEVNLSMNVAQRILHRPYKTMALETVAHVLIKQDRLDDAKLMASLFPYDEDTRSLLNQIMQKYRDKGDVLRANQILFESSRRPSDEGKYLKRRFPEYLGIADDGLIEEGIVNWGARRDQVLGMQAKVQNCIDRGELDVAAELVDGMSSTSEKDRLLEKIASGYIKQKKVTAAQYLAYKISGSHLKTAVLRELVYLCIREKELALAKHIALSMENGYAKAFILKEIAGAYLRKGTFVDAERVADMIVDELDIKCEALEEIAIACAKEGRMDEVKRIFDRIPVKRWKSRVVSELGRLLIDTRVLT